MSVSRSLTGVDDENRIRPPVWGLALSIHDLQNKVGVFACVLCAALAKQLTFLATLSVPLII